MRIDIDQPRLDFGDAVRIGGGLGLREQRGPFLISRQHDLEQRLRPAGGFLRDTSDAHAARNGNGAQIRRQFAHDHLEQGGLARAVAAEEADPCIWG
jgi:hypothetical protein